MHQWSRGSSLIQIIVLDYKFENQQAKDDSEWPEQPFTGIEMTLEELLEKETIKEIRIKYSHYFDGKMVDDLADLFCEDAVCEFGPDYGGDWVGKETIRSNFASYAEREGPPFGVLHAVTNPLITLIDSTTACGRWYLHDLNTQEGVDNPLILYGLYDDVYKKVFGKWLIYRTKIDFLWPKRQYTGFRDFKKENI
ncbi:MAG: nuclear transport factor 2 family protein [Pseudomonadales bacterium]|nr:nuclear transport factor 2 family protein [Pseudomonadales bacterium]